MRTWALPWLRLVQVYQNLIANAVHYMGDQQAPRIEVSAAVEGGEVIATVRDNGIGIKPEWVERIFVMFQRLHKQDEYPGTGIGLAICKRIVERHGGKIWVESEPNKGSTFCVSLPKG